MIIKTDIVSTAATLVGSSGIGEWLYFQATCYFNSLQTCAYFL